MRVVITGATGQLGRAVTVACSGLAGTQVMAWSRSEADISKPEVRDAIVQAAPDLVINCAAWTGVDAAESDPAAAFAANALGPLYLAQGCAVCGATMVQISTNEVFAGEPGRIYFEYDVPAPRGVYARSKAAGERAAQQALARLYVVRVAWLFGPGGENFPSKIVAAADRLGALRVVDDEFGNPTYAPDVAAALLKLVESGRFGAYHLVNEGQTSRYGFAQAVLAGTGRGDVPLSAIKQHEWPRPAQPPLNAVLANQAAAALGIRLRPWQDALAEYLRVDGHRFARAKPRRRRK